MPESYEPKHIYNDLQWFNDKEEEEEEERLENVLKSSF